MRSSLSCSSTKKTWRSATRPTAPSCPRTSLSSSRLSSSRRSKWSSSRCESASTRPIWQTHTMQASAGDQPWTVGETHSDRRSSRVHHLTRRIWAHSRTHRCIRITTREASPPSNSILEAPGVAQKASTTIADHLRAKKMHWGCWAIWWKRELALEVQRRSNSL